jgi:hypothetical protein
LQTVLTAQFHYDSLQTGHIRVHRCPSR